MKTSTLHHLKTVTPYFSAVADGSKTFEFRYDDRGYKVGDRLLLLEYLPKQRKFTGREITVKVNYILASFVGMENGYVIMGIELLAHNNE